MAQFKYQPAACVPFRDLKAIERCRKIKRKDIDKHPNKNFRIHVLKDADIEMVWIADMFKRIVESDREDKKVVFIMPNPCPTYRHVAKLINECRINCRNVYGFAMDEYADEQGRVAPESWEFGFTHAMMKYFYYSIDEDLRPAKKQIVGFTTKNVKDYSKMIEGAGEADACYSGPGWTGHLAFIEPDAPEFDAPLAQWKKFGARICTLSPFTLAQNSLHGSFGMSGDLAAVPPKAATIGPRDVLACRNCLDFHALGIHGTATSWQRLTTRLVLHGPVTPRVPESILQTRDCDVFVSETAAMDIEPNWDKGY